MNKFISRLLKKIAQETTVPTEGTTPKQLPPAPNMPASQAYPSIMSGYTSAQIGIINNLVNILNIATHQATGGAYNLQVLKNKGFSFDPSSLPSPDQKNLLNFFLKVYQKLLNSGNKFQHRLSNEEIAGLVQQLLSATELSNLSQINPSGPIAQKIQGNLQQDIKNYLILLAPTTVV